MTDSHRLYAAYFHATRPRGTETEREQFIVLAPRGVDPDGSRRVLVFHRAQTKLSHRAVWRGLMRDQGYITRFLTDSLARFTTTGWEVTDLLTVQITETEQATAYLEQATPYKILNRLGKVAKRKGVAI